MSEDSRRSDKLNKILELSNKKPTEVFDEYWIHAFDIKHKHSKSKNPGKWLIFVDVKEVDEVWKRIKESIENGLLWRSAKVATMKPNQYATDQNTKVICVYTYDWTDEADVMRIREELRKLGITQKIPYKADEDTYEGKYRVKGQLELVNTIVSHHQSFLFSRLNLCCSSVSKGFLLFQFGCLDVMNP